MLQRMSCCRILNISREPEEDLEPFQEDPVHKVRHQLYLDLARYLCQQVNVLQLADGDVFVVAPPVREELLDSGLQLWWKRRAVVEPLEKSKQLCEFIPILKVFVERLKVEQNL